MIFSASPRRIVLLLTYALLAGACAEQHSARERPTRDPENDGGADTATPLPAMPDESCDSLRKRADEKLWMASAPGAGGCQSHDDCVKLAPRLSCSVECPHLGRLARDEPRVTAELARLEAELCAPFAEAGCTATPAEYCESQNFVPRCREQECTVLLRGCGEGCSLQSDGSCRGVEECDGCPGVLEEGNKLPCARQGQSCMIGKGCASYLSCEEIGGELRWELIFPLC